MTTLSSQIAAYEEMRDILETDHFGKWVVFYGGELVDTYESFEEAAEDAVTPIRPWAIPDQAGRRSPCQAASPCMVSAGGCHHLAKGT